MPSKLKEAILKTVIYSDIFSYPLRVVEIHKYLTGIHADFETVSKTLKKVPELQKKKGFYFLKGRTEIVGLRRKKEIISIKKQQTAKTFARLLFFLPSIKVISVTGSLALKSSDKEDDIDFLILTSKNRIWIIRFFSVLLLKLLGVYRKTNVKKAINKICLNMYMSEDKLTLPKEEQDLFSAHEIIQAKPLFSRTGYENILIEKNLWIKKYLPNFVPPKNASRIFMSRWHLDIPKKLLDLLENLLKIFQLYYMKNKRTTEVIRDGYLRFHPHDARKYILAEYNKRIRKFV